MGYKTYVKLYTACITKISDYCAGVWGLGLYPKLDSVHNRAIRSYLGVHKYTPLLALKEEMGLTPPSIRKKIEMMCLWNRLNNLNEDRLPKKVFNIEFIK